MLKVALKYILPVYLLLLIGDGYLLANANLDSYLVGSDVHYSINANNQIDLPDSGVVSHHTDSQIPFIPFMEIEEEEVEDDKLHLAKKFIEVSDYYTSLVDSHLAFYFSDYLRNRLTSCERVSFNATNPSLNVILEVFRI